MSKVAVILAAGKGTRMKTDRAKVLAPLAGRPLLFYVLDAVEAVPFDRLIAVVGHQADRVREAVAGRNVECVLQEPQLGTGHAVLCAAPLLAGVEGSIAVLAGDAPLIRAETLRALLEHHERARAAVTLLSAVLEDPSGYGRVVRKDGRVVAIVEHKDASREERRIQEINSSIYAFDASFLLRGLPALRNENRQGEYYLTDLVQMAFAEGRGVEGLPVADPLEVAGVNTVEQLEEAERYLRESRA
ncbi:MAG TPA: NTP transferase domain-containing protein [Candidatus Eisenbacteria bacterium]|nr:NTP transferase domain-containing protein [Candidatus Eisenbacteria bacterium]